MAKVNDLQCVGDALFQGDVKVNGKLNNEVLDVDDNCLIIDVCRRLDLSTVGNKVEITIPNGYVGDPRTFSLASIYVSSYGSDTSVWTQNAVLSVQYTNARTGNQETATVSCGNGEGNAANLNPFCKDKIKIEVTTACTGAPKPYAIINCKIYCHKE